ncbi:unnamed protein product [Bursaphelenchus xylophilus]|nr:unnamed protein product [Bursaphelenchus xylophilus]CAD5224643.1 unnamed protein product [Bursaphelenchus xylophilus]CAD5230220.1 unnamed protein product [Bursaphelenchus xylophilus]CAD5230992.1 unnamed protein product [Bursaphelenchus xylophilus]CAG9080685.1 unnamed protein product [Bursaphelenchus xylophilus]
MTTQEQNNTLSLEDILRPDFKVLGPAELMQYMQLLESDDLSNIPSSSSHNPREMMMQKLLEDLDFYKEFSETNISLDDLDEENFSDPCFDMARFLGGTDTLPEFDDFFRPLPQKGRGLATTKDLPGHKKSERKLYKARKFTKPTECAELKEAYKHFKAASLTGKESIEFTVGLWEAFMDQKYPEAAPHKIIVFDRRSFEHGWSYPKLEKDEILDVKTPIMLYYHDNHYDSIWSPTAFFGVRSFSNLCFSCRKLMRESIDHTARCQKKCTKCCRIGNDFPCKDDGFEKKCAACTKKFLNKDCYEHHLKKNICSYYKKCDKCDQAYSKKNGHLCGLSFCVSCRGFHEVGSECYVNPIPVPKKPVNYNLCAFDFETTTTPLNDNSNRSQHSVNFASIHKACTTCMANGKWRDEETPCEKCGEHLKTFSIPHGDSENVVKDVWEYLKSCAKKIPVLAIAHFGGKFDCHLLMKEINKDKTISKIDMILTGAKYYTINVAGTAGAFTEVKFTDSFNYLQMPLGSMPKALGLEVDSKGTFPHLFNTPAHYQADLPHHPDIQYYCPDSLNANKRQELLDFYEENRDKPFNFKQQLYDYGIQDTRILLHALVKFRSMIQEHCPTDDVLYYCPTLASSCLRIWRMLDLEERTVIRTPTIGFGDFIQQSKVALLFFRWLRDKKDMKDLQFRDNGEKRVEIVIDGKVHKISIDGFLERQNEKPLALELNGCYYHGCKDCCKDLGDRLPSGISVKEGLLKTEKRVKALEDLGFEVLVYKECEIRKMLQEDDEMSAYFEQRFFSAGSIRLRDAFHGGRTATQCLKFNANERKGIGYTDIQSLYPYIMATYAMPIGIPTPLYIQNYDVNWESEADIEHDGLYKVVVLPPQNLALPVLPITCNKKLIYPLCYSCAQENQGASYNKNLVCEHGEEERSFLTTTTSVELKNALRKGYKVKKIFEILKFNEMSDALFKPYVYRFLKTKLEASGKPYDDEAKNQQFKEEIKRRYGFEIDEGKWSKNPALRTISKLYLNSLWGKLSMRTDLPKTVVCSTATEFYKILNNSTNVIKSVDLVEDDKIYISFKTSEEFTTPLEFSNLLIPTWITAQARTYLYSFFEQVESKGEKILYYDTDSLIFTFDKASGEYPLKTGDYLGDMELEKKGKDILEFLGLGAKQYALKYRDVVTGELEYDLKLRGISLNGKTCSIINYDSFSGLVDRVILDGYQESLTAVYDEIRAIKNVGVFTTNDKQKVYQGVCDKGYIANDDVTILPFGYVQ